jgi:hypothetical protein
MTYFSKKARALKVIDKNIKLTLKEVERLHLPDEIIDENITILEEYFVREEWQHVQQTSINQLFQSVSNITIITVTDIETDCRCHGCSIHTTQLKMIQCGICDK